MENLDYIISYYELMPNNWLIWNLVIQCHTKRICVIYVQNRTSGNYVMRFPSQTDSSGIIILSKVSISFVTLNRGYLNLQ